MNLKKKFKKAVRVALAVLTAFGALSLSPITSTVYAANVDYGSLSTLAQGHIGATYSTGSRLGPNSFDCSGLVDYVWNEAGIGSEPLSGGWTTATWHNYLMGMAGVTYTDTTQDSYSPGDVHAGDIIMWYNDAAKTSISNNNPYHMGIMVNSTQMVSAMTHSTELGHGGVVINNIVGGTSGGHYQYNPLDKGGSGYIRIFHLPSTKQISVNINKQSMYPDCTNNNALYSLAGAVFSVKASDGTDLGTLTTDANGKASGSYEVSYNVDSVTITETKAPDNYWITDGTAKIVTLANGTTANYNVVDEPINDPARISLTKVDKEGKTYAAPMGEAQFTISYYDTWNDSELTDAHKKAEWVIKTTAVTNGSNTMYVAYLDDEHFVSGSALYKTDAGNVFIPLGTITIKETKAADNYTVDGGYLENNSTKEVISSTETMTFKVVNETSGVVMKAGNLVLDGSQIKEERQIRGSYTLQKTDKQLVVTSDLSDDSTKEAPNYNGVRSQGDATFAGAEFDLYYLGNGTDTTSSIMLDHDGDGLGDGTEYQPSETTPIAEAHVTLDKNGYYEAPNASYLGYGNYKLVETKAPEGYSINDETTGAPVTINFTVGEDGNTYSLTAPEKIYQGSVKVHKTINPSNNSTLEAENEAGAVFDIVLKKYVEEVATKNGHDEITRADVLEAYEKRNTWTGTDESGHSVTGYTAMEYDEITTGEDGVATSKKLAYGKYCLVQVSGPKDSKVSKYVKEFEIKSENQETLTFEAINIQQPYILKLIKSDSDTGKTVTYTSSAWKIHMLTDAKGNDVSKKTDQDQSTSSYLVKGYVTQTLGTASARTTVDVFETASSEDPNREDGVFYGATNNETGNDAGSTTLPVELLPGTYQLEEVITSEGMITHEPIKFTIGEDYMTTVTANGQRVVEVTFENEQLTGDVNFTKEIVKWDEADTTLADYDLTKFGFTLTAAEDIINQDDGTVLVKAGEKAVRITGDKVNPYETIEETFADKDGNLSFTDLPLGKYNLVETTSPLNYASNTHTYNIEVKQTVFDKAVEETNKLLKLFGDEDRSVTKDDVLVTVDGETVSENGKTIPYVIKNYTNKTEITKTTITGGDELPGATIVITDENGNEVDKWISTEESHKIEGLERGKTYTLTETSAPDGYYFSNEITFTVDDNANVVQKIEMIDSPIVYEIKKVDEDGNTVAGVTLTLTDITDSENPVEVELPNGGITTDKPFVLDRTLIAEHTYKLVETELVGGVYKATDIQFTVPKYGTGDTYTITMVDDLVGTSVLKTDDTGKAIAGAKLKIVEAIKNEDGTYSAGETVYEFTSTEKAEDISKYVKGDSYYFLEEVEAPFGYEMQTTKDAEGNEIPATTLFKVTGTDEEPQVITCVNNRKHFYTSVVKIDANDKTTKLAGAVFTVYKKSDNSIAKDVYGNDAILTSGTEGTVTFELAYNPDGYYVKETSAPTGYLINENSFDVILSEDYDFAANNPVVIYVPDSLAPVEEANSGVIGTDVSVAIGCVAIGGALAALAWIYYDKSKKKHVSKETSEEESKD